MSLPANLSAPPSSSSRLRNRTAWIVAAVAVLGIATVWWLAPPKASPWPEVPRAKLLFAKGSLHLVGETQPFTGWMVESYPNGSPLSRSAISNGLLNGVSEGWYTNGQLQVREYFQNGTSHGLRQKWFESGNQLSEATIVQGKLEGTFRRWYPNGRLAEQIEMKHGQPDGVALGFYPSGFLKNRDRLEDGKFLEHHTWRDGEMKDAPPHVARN